VGLLVKLAFDLVCDRVAVEMAITIIWTRASVTGNAVPVPLTNL
jgi:hypothetical protein